MKWNKPESFTWLLFQVWKLILDNCFFLPWYFTLCAILKRKKNFLFSNKACWVNLSCLKYQVVSSLLFHILPPVSEESVYRAITVKAPQIYVFQSPDRCSFQNSHSNLIKSRQQLFNQDTTFIIYHFLKIYTSIISFNDVFTFKSLNLSSKWPQ